MAAFRRKPTQPASKPEPVQVAPVLPAAAPAPPPRPLGRPMGRPIATPLHPADPADLPPDTIPDGDDVPFASSPVAPLAAPGQVRDPRSGMLLVDRQIMAARMQADGFLHRLAGIDTEIWPELEKLWLEAPF